MKERETRSSDIAFSITGMALGRGICEYQKGKLEAVSKFSFFYLGYSSFKCVFISFPPMNRSNVGF